MAGADTPFRGSLSMNVLNTLGLVSSSFGLWMGVEGGERSVAVDEARSRYLRLEFEDGRIVGTFALGLTQHVGVVRGLIQTRVRLGAWMEKLRTDPALVMNAYLECTQGGRAMKVRVSAAGLLEEYLPVDSDGETAIEIPDPSPAATLLTVMRAAGIPALISLNGGVVPRSQHATRTVSDGDAVHFMPNLKGG